MLVKRYKHNPIITPDYKLLYERECTYNPSAVVHKNKVYLIYRAEGRYGNYISKLCLAVSKDGFYFEKYKDNPIMAPTRPEEKRGIEDPRITKIKNTYYMTYTAYEKQLAPEKHKFSLSLATSKDLKYWKKHGKIFKQMKAGLIFPEKVNNEYIMLVGEGIIRTARSKDLKKWKLDKKIFLKPRKGFFDERLVEVGPPFLILKDRIIMIYNSSDRYKRYAPFYLILDKEDPTKILYRSKTPLMLPKEQFELYGKVNDVIFAQGLVKFKNKYLLYYGGGDKCIGVAEIDIRKF